MHCCLAHETHPLLLDSVLHGLDHGSAAGQQTQQHQQHQQSPSNESDSSNKDTLSKLGLLTSTSTSTTTTATAKPVASSENHSPPLATSPANKKKRTEVNGGNGGGERSGKHSKSNGGGIQDIHGMTQDYYGKGLLLLNKKRRKRETSSSVSFANQIGQSQSGQKQPDGHESSNANTLLSAKMVQQIKLVELNATIDYSYCTKLQCTQGLGSKFHYLVPLSKYMDLEYVTLQFR